MDVIPEPNFQKILERRNKVADAILAAFDKSIPRLIQEDGKHKYVPGPYQPFLDEKGNFTTFCNCFLNDVLIAFGCNDAWDAAKKQAKMANEIYDALVKSRDWTELEMKDAQRMANHGYLVVLAEKENEHGHVCVVRPGNEQPSGRWVTVPSVVNVGKECFAGKGMNWAFSELPKFFMWRRGI